MLESIVSLAFVVIRSIEQSYLPLLIENQDLVDFTATLALFAKHKKFGKYTLNAIDLLKKAVISIDTLFSLQHNLVIPESTLSNLVLQAKIFFPTVVLDIPQEEQVTDASSLTIWLPLLYGFYEIIITCDIEVRSR